MKKMLSVSLCLLALSAILLTTVLMGNSAVNPPKTLPIAAPVGNSEISKEDVASIDVIYTNASIPYYDDRSLVADAEVIVVGSVKEVISYTDELGRIKSYVDIEIEEVLKGKPQGDDLRYSVMGGVIPALDYYKANERKISGKFGADSFEAQVSEIKSSDVVERVFMGVKNAIKGERILVFATYSEETGYYDVTGSEFFGQRFYDETSEGFCRVIDSERSVGVVDDETRELSIRELCELIAATPDNSENIKREKQAFIPSEKTVGEEDIIEKDPFYDQYKD